MLCYLSMFVRKKILSSVQASKDVLLNISWIFFPVKKCTTLQLWNKGCRKKFLSQTFLKHFPSKFVLSYLCFLSSHSTHFPSDSPVLGFTNLIVRS